MAIIDLYTKEDIQKIVQNSHSLREVMIKIGYTPSGSNNVTVKKRIQFYGIDTSHFSSGSRAVKRDVDNIFILNSTATQAVVRKWYKKGNYTPYICSICSQEPFWKDKPLTLILDHINGVHNDDRLENLRWVCPNCNQQLETTGFRKIRVRHKNKSQKANFCDLCGAKISKSKNLCYSCAMKCRRKIERPCREDFKQLIRNESFTSLSKKFGVSDKAISKWCKYYNLPYKKKDIKNYNDKEWEKL